MEEPPVLKVNYNLLADILLSAGNIFGSGRLGNNLVICFQLVHQDVLKSPFWKFEVSIIGMHDTLFMVN